MRLLNPGFDCVTMGVKLAVTSTRVQPAARFSLRRIALVAGLGIVSGALSVLGYRALVVDHDQAPAEAAAQILVAWTFVVSGHVASWRRPASRVGPSSSPPQSRC